jgi:hypothetical protein
VKQLHDQLLLPVAPRSQLLLMPLPLLLALPLPPSQLLMPAVPRCPGMPTGVAHCSFFCEEL